MSKKMLIDATHPEETRVVVSENSRVEELDVDTSTKKQINIFCVCHTYIVQFF